MQAEQTIQPINVAGAAMVVQVLLISVLGVGNHLCRESVRSGLPGFEKPERRATLGPLALFTLAVLLFTEDLYTLWSPLFPGLGLSTITTVNAILIVYFANLLSIGYLIHHTGGSASSPFLSALFTVPALAIFLRLPPPAFITVAFLAVVIYAVLLAIGGNGALVLDRSIAPQRTSQRPVAFVNIACLGLALLTGYVTRPIPITDLQIQGLDRVPASNSTSQRP
jgi:hypothetical protein